MSNSGGTSVANLQPSIGNPGLRKLSSLLRNEGDKVLSGSSIFTLTTEVLTQLNSECRRHSITESDISTPDSGTNDRSFIPLTSRMRAQQEVLKSKVEWGNHIQFIKDFLLSTPCLKLIRYSGTLSSPISLHRFGNLSHLEIRKVPIHMVEGLHKLRGTLVSITVYRSVDKVKDLLEQCGGDMSSPMSWPQLKFVSFMFNSIIALDNSLRLLPNIEVFDLSHNSLENCDKFLEYLGDAHRIILAYNSLTCVPSVAVSTRASLKCLILRGNNLVNIKGMENLTALQELDLGENLISEHSLLEPLRCLMRLKKLSLDGNPVYYHKQHRPLTVSCLAMQAVNVEFVLDKKKITLSEISKAELKRTPSYLSSISVGRGARSLLHDIDATPSASSGIGTDFESVDSIVSSHHKKKNKRKRLKPRTTVIRDLDYSGEFSSSADGTPGTSPYAQSLEQHLKLTREEAIKTQNEIEELRKHYGPNWLQAIQDRDVFKHKKALAVPTVESSDIETDNTDQENNRRKIFFVGSKNSNSYDGHLDHNRTTMSESEFEDTQLEKSELPTDDDLYLTDTRMYDNTNPIMASIARMAAGYSTDDTDGGNKSSKNVHAIPFNSHSEFANGNIFEKPINNTYENGSFTSKKQFSSSPILDVTKISDHDGKNIGGQNSVNENLKSNQNNIHESISSSKLGQTSDKAASNENMILSKSLGSLALSEDESSSKKPIRGRKILKSISPDNNNVTSSLFSPTSLLEKEEVTEPMFATLPLKDNEIIMVTFTASYLVEKDIRGRVTEQLELVSLTDMKWKKVKKTVDGVVQEVDIGESSESELETVVDLRETKKNKNGETTSDVIECIQLDLKFDYVRKDRQSRSYIVDLADGKIFIDYLQPFVNYREDMKKAELMTVMQCLKCNRTFMKSELIPLQDDLPKSGSSKDLQSVKELLGKVALVCPKCGSSHIIELDHTSTPVGSYSSSTGSYLDQFKKGKKFGKRNPKKTKDSPQKLPPSNLAREGNSAFTVPPRMIRSEITSSKELLLSEDIQIECVEDYFSADAMTSIQSNTQSPSMTKSLLGDSSSKGSKSSVKRKPNKKSISEFSDDYNESKDMHVSNGDINSIDKPTRPINIEQRLSQIESNDLKNNNNVGIGSERTAAHKNLAAMENIVNSLVIEGKYLEEQGNSGTSFNNQSKGKSVSISAFNRSSSSHHRKTSVCSVDGLKRSESSSSIAVIPIIASVTSTDNFPDLQASSSVPVRYSEQTIIDHSKDNTSTLSSAVVSPLNSSICSSMVSSVYETSVNSSEKNVETNEDNKDIPSAIGINKTNNIETVSSGVIKIIGSSCSFVEDLNSIYDHPREPKSTLRKISQFEVNALNSSLEVSLSNDGLVANNVPVLQTGSKISSDSALDKLSSENVVNSSLTTTALPNTRSSLSDDDNDEDEDDQVVPEFAFHHLNHRLTLYMMMSLFGADEEFLCKLQGEVVQYIIEKSYEGILVMSSMRFYVLKITSEDHSQTPDQWLQCVEIQPIPELRYIDVGLGGQSLRLEFVTDCSCYTFITRNKDKTVQFVEMLHTNLAKYAVSQGINSHVIVSEDVDSITLNNLDREVVSKVIPGQKLLHYCMGFIERGNQKRFPISFVTTSCDICLVCTNHQWPQPKLQAPITEETVGKQFTVLERQKISNVASVQVCEVTMKRIRLELFNETEGISTNWNITMTTKQSSVDFINALSDPWAKEFGIEMDIVYAELLF